jgi:protein gp37
MAEQGAHGITWTEATWNPIRGCSRVSEGCRNCYAERMAYRYSGPGMAYEGLVRINSNGERQPQWNGTVRVVEEHMLDPLKWKRPRRIFVNSMSDLFHESLPDLVINRIFAVMALSPRHQYQVLTKRAPQMRDYMTAESTKREVFEWARTGCGYPAVIFAPKALDDFKWPLPNVWLGVSVENQATADERIPLLLQTPAAVRWISAEPLLGAIDLTRIALAPPDWLVGLTHECKLDAFSYWCDGVRGFHWVVVGGESGPGARPMHPEWARSLRDQCVAAGVAFHFKQFGEWSPANQPLESSLPEESIGPERCLWMGRDGTTSQIGYGLKRQDDELLHRAGKRAAGRILDGRTWDEYPAVRA